MSDHEHAQGVLYLTAQAIKAFLMAFDPLEERLGEVVRAGYRIRVVLTGENPAAAAEPITFLIEMDRAPATAGHDEWTADDEAFLRTLRVSVSPRTPDSPTNDGTAG